MFQHTPPSPTGDGGDWIQFTPFTDRVGIEITCAGNGLLTLELLLDGQTVVDWGNLACGERGIINAQAGFVYQLHIRAAASDMLQYTHYTVRIISVR